jgi:hypothetical protein
MSTPLRRPLPALVALLALLLLTALVWWRVLNRDSGAQTAARCPTATHTPAAVLPSPNGVTVQVLNSTNRSGIAGKARTTLVSDGFNSPQPAANDKPKVKIRGVAVIRYGSRGQDGAKLLHYYFPGARLVQTKVTSATVVVSLGEKYRGVASPSSVQATLRRKDIQLDGAASGRPTSSASC